MAQIKGADRFYKHLHFTKSGKSIHQILTFLKWPCKMQQVGTVNLSLGLHVISSTDFFRIQILYAFLVLS
jgi:hypothetical protein